MGIGLLYHTLMDDELERLAYLGDTGAGLQLSARYDDEHSDCYGVDEMEEAREEGREEGAAATVLAVMDFLRPSIPDIDVRLREFK